LDPNEYPRNFIDTTRNPSTKQTIETKPKEKWITFIYVGKQTTLITELLKNNTNLRIAYKVNNTIEKNLYTRNKPDISNKYKHSGVYQLKCLDCGKNYIGQTGRNFKQRYREHINDIRQNKEKSGFSQHILNTGHRYSTIDDTMKILYRNKKGRLLNTVEQFYIYINTKQNSHLNDLYSNNYNPIYNTLLSYTS
jgi:hypothetical protein